MNKIRSLKIKEIRFVLACLIFVLLLVIIVALIIKNDVMAKQNNQHVAKLNCLEEENIELKTENEAILSVARRDHLIALETDTKLLVSSLAWIDEKYDTQYLNIIEENYDGEVNFAKIKELFDKDKDLRLRGVRVVNIYIYSEEDSELLTITPEYYDYLVSEKEGKNS